MECPICLDYEEVISRESEQVRIFVKWHHFREIRPGMHKQHNDTVGMHTQHNDTVGMHKQHNDTVGMHKQDNDTVGMHNSIMIQ